MQKAFGLRFIEKREIGVTRPRRGKRENKKITVPSLWQDQGEAWRSGTYCANLAVYDSCPFF
jgi:hypothetical protein